MSTDQPFKKMRSLKNSIAPIFESYGSDKENDNVNSRFVHDKGVFDKISDDFEESESSDVNSIVASENSEVLPVKGFQKKLHTVTNLNIKDTIDPVSMKYYLKSLATEATDPRVKKYNLIITDIKADKVSYKIIVIFLF
jgi:hypothetical protein